MYTRSYRWMILALVFFTLLTYAFADAGEVVVKRHAVIRAEPRGSARRLGTADPGERYSLLSESPTNKWYQIEYQGDHGWIYSHWIDLVDVSPGQNIRIASFNTLHLGWGTNKILELVATVLSGYDLIALQEVMKEEALMELIANLESLTSEIEGVDVDWDCVLSRKLGRSTYKESYAFIWRRDKVRKIPDSDFVARDDEDHFIREPFVATFLSGNFDFTLISAHFIFGKSKRERRDEARAVADIFESIQNQDNSENDIILLGDFNLPPNDKGWAEIKDVNSMTWILNPPAKTTVGNNGMKNLYDNIWFQSQYLSEYTDEGETYEFMHDIFEEDKYGNSRTHVSDHIPIYAVFKIDQPDDD